MGADRQQEASRRGGRAVRGDCAILLQEEGRNAHRGAHGRLPWLRTRRQCTRVHRATPRHVRPESDRSFPRRKVQPPATRLCERRETMLWLGRAEMQNILKNRFYVL